MSNPAAIPDPVPAAETPDGVSVTSIAELRGYLHAETGVSVGEDDPILIQFTMHRVFLNDYEQMLDRHNKALTAVIGTAVKGLTEDALSEHLQKQVRLADRTHQEFERQYRRARLLSAVNIISASACLLVFAYLIVN